MPHNSTYYLAEGFHEHYNAGVLRKYHETFLAAAGFKPLYFKHSQQQTYFHKALRLFDCFLMLRRLPKNSLLVFHFPLQATVYKLLLVQAKRRGITTAALIIDLDGIRDRDEKEWQAEIKLLKHFDHLVAHNAAMKQLLLQYLPGASISCIELFDYPFTGTVLKRERNNQVCFAGNIAKSGFTKHLHKIAGTTFFIYGQGFNPGAPGEQVIYKGVVAPAELPAVIEGSFGLVWDGDSIESCDPYLRFINPYKVSLYLAAGLPLIVWKDSALAQLVTEKAIGLVVESLHEIPGKIAALNDEAYLLLQQNALAAGMGIKEGVHFKAVIQQFLGL